MPSSVHVTELLSRARRGDAAARDAVMAATYDEVRRLARAYLDQERPDHTLQATALVHEVYLRLVEGKSVPAKNRAQFLAFAAQAMRFILINHARARARHKRGGGAERVQLAEDLVVSPEPSPDLLTLDESLRDLERIDPRRGRVVELRYFGGLTVEEIADALDTSVSTVKRDWEVARTWLVRRMTRGESK